MKKFAAFILVLAAVCSLMGSTVFAAEETETADAVIVYDENENIATVQSMAESFGKSVEAIDVDWLYAGALDKYSYILLLTSKYIDAANETGKPVLCIGDEFIGKGAEQINVGLVQMQIGDLSQSVSISGKLAVASGTGEESYGSILDSFGNTYPFAQRNGNDWIVPYFNTKDISIAGLGGVMAQFFGYQETPKLYVMLDEVYAFSDLQILKDTADALHESGNPFIVRIMPVYDNTDYPAFKRWAQLLRYIQSIGGTIVLHEPLVQESIAETVPLEQLMKKAQDALANEKVNLYSFEKSPYPVDFSVIETAQSPTRQFAALPMNTVIVYGLPKDEQGIWDMVDQLKRKWLSVSDYKRNFTNESTLYNETPFDEDYQYVQETQKSYVEFFTAGNNLLLVAVSVSIAVLAALFVVGRYFYRKKFIKKRGDM